MKCHHLVLGFACLLLGPAATTLYAGEEFGLRWEWAAPHGNWAAPVVSTYDLDGDGAPNLLTPGCFNRCWIAHEQGGSGYRQLASSPAADSPFDWISFPGVSGSVNAVLASDGGDPQLEVGTLAGGAVSTRTIAIQTGEAVDGIVVDIDGDLDLELFVIDDTDLYLHDFTSGDHEITRYGFGGSDLAAGQLDLDAQLEIVVGNWYGSCWILDGLSLAVEWGTPSECGGQIELAQVLPDAPLEILTIAAKSMDPNPLRLLDPPANEPVWTIPAPWSWWERPSFIGGDLDPGDGFEVLVSWPNGLVELLHGADGSVIRDFESYYVGALGAGDLDGDGGLEFLVAATEFSPQAPLQIFDPVTAELEDEYPVSDFSSAAVAAGDLDGDGDRELVVGGQTASEGNMKAAVHLLSGSFGTGPFTRLVPASYPYYDGEARDVVVADVDGVEGLEILLSYDIGSPFLASLDGRNGSENWRLQSAEIHTPLLVADIGGNGVVEIVTSKNQCCSVNAVTAFRADYGWLHWQSPDIYNDVQQTRNLCYGNFAGMSPARVVAIGRYAASFQMLEASSGLSLGAVEVTSAVSDLICADLDVDEELELLASQADGSVGFIDPVSGAWSSTVAELGEPIYEIETADFLGTGSPQIAVFVEDGVRLVEPSSGIVLASVEFSGESLYYTDGLEPLDVDGDGRFELVIRTQEKLTVLGLPSLSPVLLVDGFESGNAVYWSLRRP